MGLSISVKFTVNKELGSDALMMLEGEISDCAMAAVQAAMRTSWLKPHIGDMTASPDTLLELESTRIEIHSRDNWPTNTHVIQVKVEQPDRQT